jgi:beta-glucanase (GH16 family)
MRIVVILLLCMGPAVAQEVPETYQNFMFNKDLRDWNISGPWTNGNVVNTNWMKSQVRIADQAVRFVLETDKTTSTGYASGEITSRKRYRYGYFEAALKAAKADGVVTGFFTYIGAEHHEPWNEIDVEILGRDTHKVQFTYHADGKDSRAILVDLPFDASQSFHRFGFDWQPDYIRWYVDGHLMLTEDGSKLPLPSRPLEIAFDLWNGIGVDGWLKPFHWQGQPVVAEVRCISYSPMFTESSDCGKSIAQ